MPEQEARDDEREALAFRLFLIESGQDEVFLTRVWENHGDGHPVKASYLRQADALIAAGYRKHPEPEYEYLGGPNVTYRRVKAGPWVPVGEGEQP